MDARLVDMREIRFILYEVLHAEALAGQGPYEDHSRESFDMVLNTAHQMARKLFWPQYQAFDRVGAQFENGVVAAPEGMREIWRRCREGGWFAPGASYEFGGQQLPATILATTSLIFHAANTSAYMYIGAGSGTAMLISLFGTRQQQERYLPKLYQGEWSGTMCLSEPDAGSSVGDITTSAIKASDGDFYHIKGTKRWISSGDHDLAANIIHPVLARIQGAPAGTKGISLFLVPKYRITGDGAVGAFNDVLTAGIEHKLGLRGQVTATLNFGENDDCRGWLLGRENEGLKHMLHLVNSARIHTGIQAVAQASCAYQIALQYARERLQGRAFTNRDPASPPVPIIRHPDVRRMLLWQKAYVEGIQGLLAYCAHLDDKSRLSASREERERHEDLLGILTPVCKAYASDMSFESIRLALQCLGGAGFTEDFPIAQMLRDSKVFSIYEGANGIQAQDLLGRRVVKKNGAAFRIVMEEIEKTLEAAAHHEAIRDLAEAVSTVRDEIMQLTMHLGRIGMSGDMNLYMCNATSYLRAFSELIVAWQFLTQVVAACGALTGEDNHDGFYRGKIATARFYIANVLPATRAAIQVVMADERSVLDFKETWFGTEGSA